LKNQTLAGRNSLPVFVLSLVLSTGATVLVKETGYVLWVQFAIVLAGAAVMIGFASLLDWQAKAIRRDKSVRNGALAEQSEPAGANPVLARVAAEPSTK